MYAFHASDPDLCPPPVSFSLPNAPPISAPDVPMLTLAMPQSEPAAERYCSADLRFFVKIADYRPCGTPFCCAIASSTDLNDMTYRIGANVSVCTTSSEFFRPVTIVGSTKLPLRSPSALPPVTILPPLALALSTAALY